jgi:hypothetical protein
VPLLLWRNDAPYLLRRMALGLGLAVKARALRAVGLNVLAPKAVRNAIASVANSHAQGLVALAARAVRGRHQDSLILHNAKQRRSTSVNEDMKPLEAG